MEKTKAIQRDLFELQAKENIWNRLQRRGRLWQNVKRATSQKALRQNEVAKRTGSEK